MTAGGIATGDSAFGEGQRLALPSFLRGYPRAGRVQMQDPWHCSGSLNPWALVAASEEQFFRAEAQRDFPDACRD